MKQQRDVALWKRHIAALKPAGPAFKDRRELASEQLARVSAPEYLGELAGTIGADPFKLQV